MYTNVCIRAAASQVSALPVRAGGNLVLFIDNLRESGEEMRDRCARRVREFAVFGVQFSVLRIGGCVGKLGGDGFGKLLVAKDLGNDEG